MCAIAQEDAVESAAQPAAAQPAGARPGVVIGPDGKPIRPGQQPGAKPDEKTPMPGEQPKEGEKKDEKKEPEPPKALTRPEKPAVEADPEELNVHADEDGMVKFSFNGQKWDDVLQWLAAESEMSLDWQQLPGDYFNFTTPRSYSLTEARDVINRHLLARGYTILIHDGALSVVEIKQLNPAQVPRVEPGDLENRTPYEFVKVSFPLTWMVAEQAVAEVTPMLSPNHTISPLKTTNRLEIMDAVINLRDVAELINLEQSQTSQESLVKEFQLIYTRADEVREQLLNVLGMESKTNSGGGGGNNPSAQMRMMQQQMQQQMQQMQQRMAQQGGNAGGGAKQDEKVTIVADVRRNVIIAQGPPDKLAVIEQTIKLIDQSTGRIDSLEAYVARTQVYRLASIDPQQLVDSLKAMGGLDPRTRLTVDESNSAVIAYATPLDHYSIDALVKKLDGSARKTRVVSLRRLRADLVAGSVDYLMGSGQKQEDSSRNRYSYYDYYYSSRYGNNDQDKKSDKFRVTANIESNQLLLWANDVEYEQVLDLLVQLGEVRVRGGSGDIVRVIDTSGGAETARFLEELKRKWESLGENEIVLPSEEELQRLTPPVQQKPAPQKPAEKDAAQQPPAEEKEASAQPPRDRATQAEQEQDTVAAALDDLQFLTGLQADEEQIEADDPPTVGPGAPPIRRDFPADPRAAAAPPKISISIDPDGRLVISSRDTAALDRLEELMTQLAPPRRDFKVYYLKHADAFWVRFNLEDFFEDEMEEGGSNQDDNYWRGWYGVPPSNQKDDPAMLLAKRPPIRFIDDLDTNSILVRNATPDQLQIIGELVELYDVPPPEDAQAARVTKLFQIRYSKARIVAETIKDAYRDLLSSNDKALQNNNNQQQQNQRPDAGTTFISNYGGFRGNDQKEEEPEKRPRITFEGKLSIGIDEYTNTLLVSAEGDALMAIVGHMITDLDEAAKPVGKMQVVRLGAGVNSEQVREVLSQLISDQPGRQQQQPQPENQPNQGQPGQPQQPRFPQQGRAGGNFQPDQ